MFRRLKVRVSVLSEAGRSASAILAFYVPLIPHSFLQYETESTRIEKVLRGLVIYMSKLDEFKHFDAAFARLAFREEGVRPAHVRGDFALRQSRFFAGRDELFEKSVIESLIGRCSSLARDSCLRLLLFLHLSSVGIA